MEAIFKDTLKVWRKADGHNNTIMMVKSRPDGRLEKKTFVDTNLAFEHGYRFPRPERPNERRKRVAIHALVHAHMRICTTSPTPHAYTLSLPLLHTHMHACDGTPTHTPTNMPVTCSGDVSCGRTTQCYRDKKRQGNRLVSLCLRPLFWLCVAMCVRLCVCGCAHVHTHTSKYLRDNL